MRILLVVVAVFGCRRGERADVLESHVADLQRRIGTIEVAGQPAWWCSAERCERAPFDGGVSTATAWCPRDDGPCRLTLEQCGPACVGVR